MTEISSIGLSGDVLISILGLVSDAEVEKALELNPQFSLFLLYARSALNFALVCQAWGVFYSWAFSESFLENDRDAIPMASISQT